MGQKGIFDIQKKDNQPMKILVTGGAGYIGSHTVRRLVKGGYDVVVLDNLVYGHKEAIVDEAVELVIGDIGDVDLVHSLFKKYTFDAVIHFAAYAYVGESVDDPLKYYKNNTSMPLVLLKAMQSNECKKFIFSSTCATYGNPETLPISEREIQTPINPYGQSKLMLEKILDDCDSAWGLKSVCLRYFNACGASIDGQIGESHEPETHLIPLVLEAALGKRESIKVFGTDYNTTDGTCIRDYIHVEDLASAHTKAYQYLGQGESLKCNLGTGNGFSVKDIIETARKVTGREIFIVEEERRAGDPASLVADPSLAKEKLGWVARYSDLENVIDSAWDWELQRRF